MAKIDAEYAAALDKLAADRAAGAITQGVHDVRREVLLAEVRRANWPNNIKFLIVGGTIFMFLSFVGTVLWFIADVLAS